MISGVDDPRPFLILISGPTGTGKSEVAVGLAKAVDGEIINADSVQIYRGLDIGSAKPGPELLGQVPHHLYDRLDLDEHLDVARWVELAEEAILVVVQKGRIPIVVGGTNFYLRALLRGLPELPSRQPVIRERLEAILDKPSGARHLHRVLRSIDPAAGERIKPADRHRIERAIEVFTATGRPISSFKPPSPDSSPRYPHLQFALSLDREILRERLEARVRAMYEAGLIEEVRQLLERYPRDLRPLDSIGYREAVAALEGSIDQAEAMTETIRRTKAYSRRQMTWLRAERDVHWVDASESVDRIIRTMVTILQKQRKEPGSDEARHN